MSKIINPNTGMPTSAPAPSMEESVIQLMQFATMTNDRVNAMAQQLMHLGLFVEFFTSVAVEAKGPDGESVLGIDMNEFVPWAQAREAEIRDAAKKALAEKTEEVPTTGQLDLSE